MPLAHDGTPEVDQAELESGVFFGVLGTRFLDVTALVALDGVLPSTGSNVVENELPGRNEFLAKPNHVAPP